MKTNLRMKCSSCGHWNRVPVNKLFIEQSNPIEPKVKVLIPMSKPLEVSKCEKCGKTVTKPKELIRITRKIVCMLSEKSYWILLIMLFSGFALLVWFLLMPLGIIEYNLGVNLSTGSLFMILTIVFLSWMINLRERLQWKSVEEKVYKRIRGEIYVIFTELSNICECTHGGGMSHDETFDQFFNRMTLIQLKELNKKVELNELGKKYLPKGAYASFFETMQHNLSDIELKYFKFLNPDLVCSLMDIQSNLHALSLHIQIKAKRTWLELTDERFFVDVSTIIHNIVKEIYKIHKMGIEIVND